MGVPGEYPAIKQDGHKALNYVNDKVVLILKNPEFLPASEFHLNLIRA